MTRSADRRVRLIASPWDRRPQQHLPAFGHRIAIAEGGQKGLIPTTQKLPRPAICRDCWVIRRNRNQDRKLASARLETLFRKGRIIGGDDFRGKQIEASALDDLSDWESRCFLRELPPCHERVTDWTFASW